MLINTDQYRLNKNVIKTIYSSKNNSHKISKSTSYCILRVKEPKPIAHKIPTHRTNPAEFSLQPPLPPILLSIFDGGGFCLLYSVFSNLPQI